MDELLNLLKTDARASLEDLAKELNCTEREIAEKIDRLERDGVVLGYHAIINPDIKSDSAVTAVIEVKITPERGGGFDRLASRISKFEQVENCYLMSGGYDLLIMARGDSLQEIAAFIAEKLSTIKGVISTATHFRLKSYKENGVLLLREESRTRLAVAP